jgi:hypothetical protein
LNILWIYALYTIFDHGNDGDDIEHISANLRC